MIIISSDHGENQGELNIYGDHHTSDYITARIPMIIRMPGKPGGIVDEGLHYNYDLPPTLMDLFDEKAPAHWDGRSYAAALDGDPDTGRECLVLGNCAWSCQRSVRWDNWILLRSYNSGAKNFRLNMLFDIAGDPHETHDLADERPDLVNKGLALLEEWHADMMATSESTVDPLWTVMAEGGPYHTRHCWQQYAENLRETGRAQHAAWLEAHDGGFLVGDHRE
jgi:arylsulfatase A-like enzyme